MLPEPASEYYSQGEALPTTVLFEFDCYLCNFIQELEQEVEEFGKVTHCTVLQQCNEAGLSTALVRSGCENVFVYKAKGFFYMEGNKLLVINS